jgi:hypothetical protein
LAALPFACFAAPYIIHRQLPSLVNGLLILPQRRLMFASMEMPPAYLMLLGIPLVALLTPFSTVSARHCFEAIGWQSSASSSHCR